jgi:hypothetical protein
LKVVAGIWTKQNAGEKRKGSISYIMPYQRLASSPHNQENNFRRLKDTSRLQ